MSTSYRLVASDMDGTLLNAEHELSQFTKETLLRLAIEKNVIFVFATGRHYRALGNSERELKAYFDNAYNALTHKSNKAIKLDNNKTDTDNNKSSTTLTSNQDKQTVEAHQSEQMQERKVEEVTICTHPGFFLVTFNGARIHNPAGELIRSHDISSDLVRALYERYCIPFTHRKGKRYNETHNVAANCDFYEHITESGFTICTPNNCEPNSKHAEVMLVSVYTTDDWFISGFIDSSEVMCKQFGMVPRAFSFDVNSEENETRCVFDDFPVNGVGKFCFRCHNQQVLLELEKDILAHFGDRLSVVFSDNYFLDVMTADVSKASAVEEVVRYVNEHGTYNNMSRLNECRQEGIIASENKKYFNGTEDSNDISNTLTTAQPFITMNNVLAFGDSMNDAAMIAAAGRGFIMQNGQARLKQELPQCEVIKGNNVDGVAQKLREVFDLHEKNAIIEIKGLQTEIEELTT